MGILYAIMLLGVLIVVWAVVDRVICFFLEDFAFARRIALSAGLISVGFWMLERSR